MVRQHTRIFATLALLELYECKDLTRDERRYVVANLFRLESMEPRSPACGNLDCNCSTGVHEGLTFGTGDLDLHGFWEHGCRPCAAAHDASMDAGRREELEAEYIAQYVQGGMSIADARSHVRRYHEWLYEPAWPLNESVV